MSEWDDTLLPRDPTALSAEVNKMLKTHTSTEDAWEPQSSDAGPGKD